MVGLARPMAVCPDFPNRLLGDASAVCLTPRPTTGVKAISRATMLDVTYYEAQLERMARGLPAAPDMSAWTAVLTTVRQMGLSALRPRRA